jgi:hypothetical protein
VERKLFTVSAVVWLVLGIMMPAFAHHVSDYPSHYGWKYTSGNYNRVFYTAPVSWPDNWNARADDAMAAWTAIPNNALSFSRGGDAAQDAGWVCGSSFDFLTTNLMDPALLAETTPCAPQNSTVRIKFNTYFYDWYHGASTPNTSTLWDVQGVLTHELGHANQAWSVCSDDDPGGDPCPGAHYDTSFNSAICDLSDQGHSSTMCYNGFDRQFSWYMRSLEPHDKDLPAEMY